MAKKSLCYALLATILLLSCLASCANPDSQALAKDQANAYLLVFESLYGIDAELNQSIKYVAVDLKNVKLTDTREFVALMQEFCDGNGFTMLQDDFESLAGKGYIENQYFKDGILVTFDDAELGRDTLETSAMKWRSAIGIVGADYKVEKANGEWNITSTEITMIT